MKYLGITIATCLALLAGCTTMMAPKTAESGKGLLIGANTSSIRVLIRTIDDGEVLWVGNYQLAGHTSVKPGTHKVGVMCEVTTAFGKLIKPSDVVIDIQVGKVYDLIGKLSKDGQKCVVESMARA